jgi:hypothetical protein
MMKGILLLTDIFVWMCAYGAMLAGMAFIVSKIVPRMPNKASRFVVLFVLGVPYGMAYGYSKALVHGYWLHRYTEMSWTEALILALPGAVLIAILCTFWLPLSRNSNIQ